MRRPEWSSHHGHGVELLEGVHGPQQDHHHAAALHRLDGSGQQVGSDCLEVLSQVERRETTECQTLRRRFAELNVRSGRAYLQDAHAKRVSQDLVRLIVVAVADVGGGDEELKRVVLVEVQRARFDLLLQLLHALLPIAASDSGDTASRPTMFCFRTLHTDQRDHTYLLNPSSFL